ncbi:MAG: hypothetical protein CME21_10125 [Gemmatimonadetes bacterium]|jgi:hypothetical protein|nr:hypothetical protein [Gemmatimonadota bacterium]MBE82908.1 hypothetical protein [Gemmatimonadota bacterium]HCK10688.1 hypothetical protein [Candidatus Latescibacterota bacterium]
MNVKTPHLYQKQHHTAHREASWSRDGYNRDWRIIQPSEKLTLADLEGPGAITHLWFAIDNDHKVTDPRFPRKVILRMYWDDNLEPAVEAPVGDFFGVGHGRVANYRSALFDMSINPNEDRGAFNCWITMPFAKNAKLELENTCETVVRIFYYVDYQRWSDFPEDTLYFHSSWRSERCQAVPLSDGQEGPNLTGNDNYVILNTKGSGTYIGCNLSVDNHAGGWWGEGDDMIFVDGDAFPGSLHGTGSEDYFCHAWGMQANCYPYAGISLFNHGHENWEGQWTMYRFHIIDPIPFTKSIRVTIEHGHNNHRSDHYASTAYWYQN